MEGRAVEEAAAGEIDERRDRLGLLALWGGRWYLEDWYDVLAIWREWADDVSGRAVDAGHYLAEERPDDVLDELRAFFATTRP